MFKFHLKNSTDFFSVFKFQQKGFVLDILSEKFMKGYTLQLSQVNHSEDKESFI